MAAQNHQVVAAGNAAMDASLYEPYSHCNSQRYLSEYGGVTIKDHDPERIRAAATQMLWRCDGDAAMTMGGFATRANLIYQGHGNSGIAARGLFWAAMAI